ncbi:MAG: DUF2237 domain-containing protein [Cryomorphaceae bacterium]
MEIPQQYNVFGQALIACSQRPLTGFFRNGCCDSDARDQGVHTVCAVMTEDFLLFSKALGNDLMTPRPEFDFEGLTPGDKWCLCAPRWKEAHDLGCAPNVVLEATNEKTLELISLDTLVEYAFRGEINSTNQP